MPEARLQAALDRLEWRHLGPFRGGRVVAVAGHPREVGVYWFGSTGGGVWKTDDAGENWANVSDGYFGRASVGGLDAAPSDPSVLYAGLGESTIRNTASHGDGVYRSTDGGATWTHRGLRDTRHIGRVRVDPHDPDTVFVAALGHANGPNAERGLFRSRDGGARWTNVLNRGPRAGAVDVSIDPQNPRVVYAATWETLRRPWGITSGGPGSGLFRSPDGGDSWTELSRGRGFPTGVLGRIGVVASPARSGRIYAIVEAAAGGLYRSDDHGESWIRCAADAALWYRSYYFNHVVADPSDADTVWVLNTDLFRSIDGGLTFQRASTPHGDNHDLWIDPGDSRRMLLGCDGGAAVTFNGAVSWSSIANQPTAELYHVATDSREPYHVYAAQQDCGTVELPTRSFLGAITPLEARDVGGGETGAIAVRPDDHNIVYASNISGYLTRYDARTGQSRNIEVWPEARAFGAGSRGTRHRWTWSTPVALSPHDPRVLYIGGERLFRSDDEGTTWRAISPDLTRNDISVHGVSGSPIGADRAMDERDAICTIITFAESPARAGVLWVGTDDGLVQTSADGGRSWRDVTPKAIRPWTLVTSVEPSPHDPATAYVSATRYLLDDHRPMLFATRNHGRTWRRIDGGIGADEITRVIREDTGRRGLLFAGTEAGAYASFDDGAAWHRLRGGLPVTPVHDLAVKAGDLVAATHGRGFWVLDDITALRADFARAAAARVPRLFPPRAFTRFQTGGRYYKQPIPGRRTHNYRIEGATTIDWTPLVRPGERTEQHFAAGRNPADGVIIRYVLPRADESLRLDIVDARGAPVASFRGGASPETPPREAGLNRFVWDTRHAGAAPIGNGPAARGLRGPFAVPGTYRVRLAAGERLLEESFEVRGDPHTGVSAAAQAEQLALLLRLRDAMTALHGLVDRLRARRARLDARAALGRPAEPRPLRRRLDELERAITQPLGMSNSEVFTEQPKLASRLAALAAKVGTAEAAPTRAAAALALDLERQAAALRLRYEALDRELARYR